jgi:hypothetical protein
MDTVRREVEARPIERYQEPWVAWPVARNAIWVGALAALAAALIIGLLGVALGAHELVPPRRVVRVARLRLRGSALLGGRRPPRLWCGGLGSQQNRWPAPCGGR